jgi:hypothetical protein
VSHAADYDKRDDLQIKLVSCRRCDLTLRSMTAASFDPALLNQLPPEVRGYESVIEMEMAEAGED